MFVLWGLTDGESIVITRGRTQKEANIYLLRGARRGIGLWPADALPIDDAISYSETHAPGWLERQPHWMEKNILVS